MATVCWLRGTLTSPASSPSPLRLKPSLVTQSSLTLRRRRQTRGEIQRCTSASAGKPSVQGHCQTPVSPKAARLMLHWEQCWWLVRPTGMSWWWSPGGQFKQLSEASLSKYFVKAVAASSVLHPCDYCGTIRRNKDTIKGWRITKLTLSHILYRLRISKSSDHRYPENIHHYFVV